MDSKTQLTTVAGIPVGENRNSLGARGAGLLSAWHVFTVPTTKRNLTPE